MWGGGGGGGGMGWGWGWLWGWLPRCTRQTPGQPRITLDPSWAAHHGATCAHPYFTYLGSQVGCGGCGYNTLTGRVPAVCHQPQWTVPRPDLPRPTDVSPTFLAIHGTLRPPTPLHPPHNATRFRIQMSHSFLQTPVIFNLWPSQK